MLTNEDVSVGIVAILDGEQLMRDEAVTGHFERRAGIGGRPFLCIAVEGSRSHWLQLTRQWSQLRISIDAWKQPGSPKWMEDKQYISDARHVFSGPHQSFIAASSIEKPHHPHRRPWVNDEGVEAVIAEIKKYNHSWTPGGTSPVVSE